MYGLVYLVLFSYLTLGIILLPWLASFVIAQGQDSLWSSGSPMPTTRSEVAATLLGDDIYVIGGFDEYGTPQDVVEVYNISNDSWGRVPPLPEPLHHTSAAAHGGKIYVVGGFPDVEWTPTDSLYVYDPSTNRWSQGPNMPTARGGLTANFVNGTFYAIGGAGPEVGSANEAYDTRTNSWEERAPMPTTRDHAASTVADGKLYVFGGRVPFGEIINVDVSEVYDPSTDEWISVASMPTKRSGSAAAYLNGTGDIYVIGGEDPSSTFNTNSRFDIESNSWTLEQPLPTARHGLGVVGAGDRIYVIAGGPQAGLSVSGINEIYNARR